MNDLTSKQRAFLMSIASKEKAVIQIGKDALSPSVTDAVDEALAAREIVKVGVQKTCPGDRHEIAAMMGERTHSVVVQVIGRKIVLYRQHKDPEKRIRIPM